MCRGGITLGPTYRFTIPDFLLLIGGEETIESKRNLFRFYHYVKSLLPNSDMNLMLAASKTLGKIAEIGGAAFGEHFMDYEVPAAINLLQSGKQEPGGYAGVLILKELARHSANYFHSHVGLVFDKILVPLRDPRVIVREGAAELLAACLEIVAQRDRQQRNPYLIRILQDAQAGLRMSQPEIIHGSLITYRELLLHGGMVSVLKRGYVFRKLIRALVHERRLPGLRRTDLELPTAQGQSGEENGYNSHSYPGGLRHPNILGTLLAQSYGASSYSAREAQRAVIR